MANKIRHNYRAIFAYDPVSNKVGKCKFLNSKYLFRGDLFSTVYSIVYRESDHTKEIILGVSITNDIYQLSTQEKGYVKEDSYTVRGIKRGRLFRALSQKQVEMNVKTDFD